MTGEEILGMLREALEKVEKGVSPRTAFRQLVPEMTTFRIANPDFPIKEPVLAQQIADLLARALSLARVRNGSPPPEPGNVGDRTGSVLLAEAEKENQS